MALARRLTSLGRAARSEASVKVRQPLTRALVFLPGRRARDPARHRGRRAERRRDRHRRRAQRGDPVRARAELQHPRAAPGGPGARTSSRRWPRSTVPRRPRRSRRAAPSPSTLGGEPVELSPDDVQLRVRGQQGFAVSREGGEVVALDLTLDESLRKRGLAREVVRLVQDLRKTSGLDVSDRIRLHVVGLDADRRALRLHRPRGPRHRDRPGSGRGGGHGARARRRAADTAGAGVAAEGGGRVLT